MQVEGIRGLIAPILTPFNDDLSVATDLYVAHAQRMLDQGCAGIAPFGTTGEALSVGIDERIAAIRDLIDGGIDPARMIPGTGLSNVADTARLSRACLDMGCAAVLTLPPFYFKSVTEDGLYRHFERLIAAIGSDARIYLYHIPPIAIVGVPPTLAARLRADFPDQIVGIKDSSGSWDNTRALLDIEGMIVYPGSELPLLDALKLGAPGCISATANINASNIVNVLDMYTKGDMAGAQALHETVKRFRLLMEGYSPVPAQKRLLAIATNDARWANVRPPLTTMSEEAGRELAEILKQEFDFEVAPTLESAQ
ncbi:MAG: dihydrodipicolinate synthase family protein [Gammaproteobacteria bacterium]|nr:dihydrodipicolinate synthase family protein [Gammaproteobacteria bacterium]MDH3416607.1 dihydrodipicolinate synthase family protein [Gammaproteobacteria bacterium]